MQQTQLPNWTTYATVLGLGAIISALVGAFVNYLLSTYRQKADWINDNKKAEWRELIDVLNECMDKKTIAFEPFISGPASDDLDWHNARWRGTRIIRDRIFIADAIEEIDKAWDELVSYIVLKEAPREPTQQGGLPTMGGYVLRSSTLRDLLTSTARKDFGMKETSPLWMAATGQKPKT